MDALRRLRRKIKFAWQRLTRGWDDSVIWSINSHLSEMLPIWLRMLKNQGGTPGFCFEHIEGMPTKEESGAANEKWHKILDQMIEGFEAANQITTSGMLLLTDNEEEYQKLVVTFETGMKVFVDNYFSLWF